MDEFDAAVVSVTELNTFLRDMFESIPPLRRVTVRGEVSNYRVYSSGHAYFTLKDAGSALRCVMFKYNMLKLRFRPENGMQLLATGEVEVYVKNGEYQLICSDLKPDGAGDLQAAFEQLKKKLEAEGLFAESHKKPLPKFPKTICIVTSADGAAVRDIIRIAGKRWPFTKLRVLPVRVQGAEASGEIAAAIAYANRFALGDLIITGRGGGSIEDLWAFNEEIVARAIFNSEIPVISAVGHEPDVTISDYVADRRASTPSNAAEIALPDSMDYRTHLNIASQRLQSSISAMFNANRRRLTDLADRSVLQRPENYLNRRRMDLDNLTEALIRSQSGRLERLRRASAVSAASLDALSPLRVLSRGYAIPLSPEGNPIRSVKSVKTGDDFRLALSDGSLSCRVNKVYEEVPDGRDEF